MWTPKRIILLVGGFLCFTLSYLVYSLTSLGRINTLPPLPEQYQPSNDRTTEPAIPRWQHIQPTPLELKLERAFGNPCKESKWPFLLELSSKSMVLAAVKCEPTEDGRIHLAPMSLALFGKKKDDGREVEINTLKCKEAYIRFDRPVSSFSPRELDGRKLVEAELFGDTNTPILITNNRRSKVKEDDLLVRITNGPLYYIEKSHLVRTSDHVNISDGEKHIVDGQLIPPKAVIDAKGMEMELTTSSPPPRPGLVPSAKPKNESISGVKRIVLREAVDMTLYVASGGPFPGSHKASGAASAPREEHSGRVRDPARPNAAKPSIVHIVTPGRFEYQLFKDYDTAVFEVAADAQQLNSLQDVTVDRINGDTGYDMLVCKRLELRLKRRNEAATRRDDRRDSGSTDQGIEIETAHATGPYVTLTSDSEKLDAHGTDFFHDAGKKLTILKGTPYMEANKEDSLIQAPEMRIQEVPLPAASSPARGSGEKGASQAAKTYQQVQAAGPGEIHMLDKKTGKRTVHAYWKDKLLSTRDWSDKQAATRDGGMDLLILNGSALFIDDEHNQSLKAETLKVWLLSEDKKPQPKAMAVPQPQANPPVAKGAKGKGAAAKEPATASQSRRPHRIEALRNVLAHSAELNIHDAARLVVHITDVPSERMPPPSSSNGKPGAAPLSTQTTPAPVFAPVPQPPATGPSVPPSAEPRKPAAEGRKPVAAGRKPVGADRKPEDEKQPIDLSARSIEAKVLRCEERMVLDHLWAEGGALDNVDKRGGVIVRQEGRQEPGKPRQEGVYIEGNTLDMSATAEGNKLHVTGDLARLKMDKIFILGPEVTIDQVENKAWVDGEGAMQMYSDKTLDGKPLKRPVPLTIHWSQSMVFFGTCAEFYGSIQAEQKEAHDDERKDARLACQHLQVRFDRPISLKAGMHGDQPAKVSMLVADKGTSVQDVRVEDQLLVRDKLEKYQLLMGREIHMTTVPRDDDAPRQPGKSNDANEVRLYGPGTVRLLQRGNADLTVTPGKSPPNGPMLADRPPPGPAAQEQVMKLTYISFEKQMRASGRTNVASFWEGVRVLNLPCNNPHLDIDLDTILVADLPVKAMYLSCNVLKVGTYQRQVRDSNNKVQGRTYQEMDARGRVYVQGREFTAQCDHMTFNEEKDQVIFYGEGDNLAVLSRTLVKGDKPDTVRAKKIIYYRSTGRVSLTDFGSYDG